MQHFNGDIIILIICSLYYKYIIDRNPNRDMINYELFQ